MDESWDAENFEPKLTTALTSSKWEGEDEEEDVKESWEDDEEEKKDEEKKELAPAKNKKKLSDKIAEKERAAKAEAQRRGEKTEITEEMTPEQRLAEKLRRQKLQEESDLRVAMETFGITDSNVSGKIDSFTPTTKEEFVEFADLLSKKINLYRTKEEFPAFVEDLFRNITVQMSSLDIKRIKTTVDNIYIEKQKTEKNDKAKKAAKGKGKAKLRVEGDNDHNFKLNKYCNLVDWIVRNGFKTDLFAGARGLPAKSLYSLFKNLGLARSTAHLNQYDSYGNYEQDYDDFM